MTGDAFVYMFLYLDIYSSNCLEEFKCHSFNFFFFAGSTFQGDMSGSFGTEEGRECLKGELPAGSHQDLPEGGIGANLGGGAIPDPFLLCGHSTALCEGLPGTQEVSVRLV